ncbi:regulator of chromosome condensation 1/beta-lactamase-inhibitor protein II [Mycena amicta]|nr:regulator of chromosome condensation 1/beta-lactamase-inhibitor protein II [Mycena amicta]
MLLSAGSNAHGQLSNNSVNDSHRFIPCSFSGEEPGVFPARRQLLDLAFGANHTLALLERLEDRGTELWGCGDGKAGQLGPAYTTSTILTRLELDLPLEAGYSPRLVAAAWETSYVVLSSQGKADVLIAMGANDFGDLGVGKNAAQGFHVVNFDHLLNGKPLLVRSITAGQHHVLAILKDLVVGWGASRHGQLGDAVEKPFAAVPAVIDEAIASIAVGHQHTVFLCETGTVCGLGSNRKRQLEGLEGVQDARAIHCTWNGTYISAADGNVLSSGNNAHGQLGREDEEPIGIVQFPFTGDTHKLVQLACGSEHVLAVFRAGDSIFEVWGWGWNEHGNLGNGATEDVRMPCRLWSSSSRTRVWAGSGTSWIQTL